MKTLTPHVFEEIATCEAPLCVSLYMEMSAGGGEHDHIRIAMKNAKSAADDAIARIETDMDPKAVAAVKKRLATLDYDDVAGGRDRRVAVFIAPEMTQVVDARFDETSVHVGSCFRVAPLVAHLEKTPAHAVLVVSNDQACLYLDAGAGLEEQKVQDMPASLSEISQYTDQQEKGNIHGREDSGIPASYRGGIASPSGPAGPAGVPHHSMGGHDWREDHEEDLRNYANFVVNAVQSHLSGTNMSLVIVADERLYGMLRASSGYPFLADEGIMQHPNTLDDRELARLAAACLDDKVQKTRDQAWDKVAMSLGRGDGEASDDPMAIVEAAAAGRVGQLFVQSHAALRGDFDPQSHSATADAGGAEDLIDRAIIDTLRNGGEVFALQDRGEPETILAAAFRYAV